MFAKVSLGLFCIERNPEPDMLTKTTLLPPSEDEADATEAQRAADDPIMPAPTTANLCFIVPHNTAVFFETEALPVLPSPTSRKH